MWIFLLMAVCWAAIFAVVFLAGGPSLPFWISLGFIAAIVALRVALIWIGKLRARRTA